GLADIDGDGDLDLVTGARNGPVRVYSNDGTGTFTEVWASAELGDVPSIAFADFDGDGDPDLAVAGRDGPSRVYRNDPGAFPLVWWTPASETTWSVDWYDVAGDGDPALTLGNHDQSSRIYRNDGGTLVDWVTLDLTLVRDLRWASWPVAEGQPSACDRARWNATP